MLGHIIRRELLDHLLSLRFAIACVVCLVVLLLSSIVLTRDYREALSTYNMNTVMHRNEVLQRTEVFRLWDGVIADRPLNVMNILVRGLNNDLTESIKVQPGNRLDFPESYEQNPVLSLFPSVDFVFIVGIIMSLLALTFAYDTVAGERESGVLKLMMSYSVPRDRVLLGKWIGGYLALIAPFIIAFLGSLLVILLFPEVEPTADHMLAIFALLMLALFYIAAVFSLGMFVSCRTEIASTSITVLLLIWVVLILALPNMSPYITSQLMPVDSRQSIDREKAEVRMEGQRKIAEIVKAQQDRTGNENVWNDEDFQAEMQEHWQKVEADAQKVEDSYTTQVQEQARWSGLVARISPLTSFNLAAFELAAAGSEQEKRFVEQLEQYSKTWEEYSNEKRKAWDEYMAQNRSEDRSFSVNSAEMERFNNLDLSDYPRFGFDYMSFRDRLSLVYLDLGLLAVWNVLFFMLAYISFLRYDVR
jgi:ABC-type transport system involved in multi-copper enzyme maturation permease subunit